MQHKWLLVLVLICTVFLTQLDAQSDDTKEKIQEKRKSIKTLISKIRSRLDKKGKSGKLIMEKSSAGSPAKMMAAQIECAASKIKGVETCCPSLNKTLQAALDVDECAVDLASLLELGRKQPLPLTYQKYTLNHLQGLYTNKILLMSFDESTKEQMCVSECLIRKLRSNSRQTVDRKSGKNKKTGLNTKELFKTSFDECQKITKTYEKETVTFGSKTCSVTPYLHLQCAIRKTLLACSDFKAEDLCEHQRELLQYCDPFVF